MLAPRLALLFSMMLLVSAGLLFSVQPMVSKMLLPTLGGAPLVWTTAMVFFQTALLLGYFYAYGSIRLLSVRHQILLHIVLLLAVLFLLPLEVSERWGAPDFEHPQNWLLMVLGGVIAFPFVVIAGSTTLAQNWFAHSNHPRARDPYFLYAASNLGSIIALLAYPLAIEPRLPLAMQSSMWSMIYVGFIALVLACGASVWRRVESGGSNPVAPVVQETSPPPTWSTRMQWLALAFAPSMLLLAVTLHLQTDVAAVPLLWVAPLAVYLLTFVVTFY